eukprot:9867831-Alexandrium_andersonii.AAC.1
MHNCCRRRELGLRGPKNNLRSGPRICVLVRTDTGSADESGDRWGFRSREIAKVESSDPQNAKAWGTGAREPS